jgi:hypothetical protein
MRRRLARVRPVCRRAPIPCRHGFRPRTKAAIRLRRRLQRQGDALRARPEQSRQDGAGGPRIGVAALPPAPASSRRRARRRRIASALGGAIETRGTIILAGRLRAMLDAGVWMTAGIRQTWLTKLASMPRLYDPGGRDADLPRWRRFSTKSARCCALQCSVRSGGNGPSRRPCAGGRRHGHR